MLPCLLLMNYQCGRLNKPPQGFSLKTKQLSPESLKKDLPVTTENLGELQKHLFNGEYDEFKQTPILEGTFLQITKKGGIVDICNKQTIITLGIAATNPSFPVPDVVLLADCTDKRNVDSDKVKVDTSVEQMKLRKLYPLKLVNISVSDAANHRLKLKLANGCVFYLQLNGPEGKEAELFKEWETLTRVMKPQTLNDNLLIGKSKKDIKEGVTETYSFLKESSSGKGKILEDPTTKNGDKKKCLNRRKVLSSLYLKSKIAKRSQKEKEKQRKMNNSLET
ncbi:Golgi-associated RAB2 interactor protein 6-like [Discoglossus pictus]